MNKSTKKSRAASLATSLLVAALTLMSLSGCKEVVLIGADQAEVFVKSNSVFQVPMDGVFMPQARYQRYRRAVADKIQEAQAESTNAR